jgi:hypothetical protein
MSARHAFVVGLSLCVAAASCGKTEESSFGPALGVGTDAGDGASDGGEGNGNGFGIIQDDAPAAPPCVNLACKQKACDLGRTTSLSGTVWDPAGKNPLYNVAVYVPNAPLEAISHGPVCDSCGGAPITGSPLVATLTDANGQFTLRNVPVGQDIPLVLQVGKWRRQVTIPAVAKECEDNPVTDANLTRLPRNKTEGDMPRIALAAGCDPLEVLMQKIGIDKSEFTDAKGTGSVHVYAGKGSKGGVLTATDAYTLWGSLTEMMKYDIVINACECSPYPRDTQGPAYDNMLAYLNAGGRVFGSHYQLNFFGSSSENRGKAAAELNQAAVWSLWGKTPMRAPYRIDTTFPKGKAMDDWLSHLSAVSKWGPSIKKTSPGTIDTTSAGDIGGIVPGVSQRWIYPSVGEGAVYVTINTPVSKPAADRCGRAVATDLHVGTSSTTRMTESEAALEFIFFDLASCVIDDAVPPPPPGPN